MLQQVLEADEQNETAWLWLSGVVESPSEQRACLERVLALNPENAAARRGLRSIQEPQESQEPVPAVPLLTCDEPRFHCPYCNTPLNAGAGHCERCRRRVYVRDWLVASPSLLTRWLARVWAVRAVFALLWTGFALWAISLLTRVTPPAALPAAPSEFLACVRAAQPGPPAALYALAGIGATGLLSAVALAWATRKRLRPAPVLSLTVVALQAGMAAWGYYLHRWVLAPWWADGSPCAAPALAGVLDRSIAVATVLDVGLLLGLLVLTLSGRRDFATVRRWLTVQPEEDLNDAGEAFERGRSYSLQGMWAAAAAYWQHAVALAPDRLGYSTALAYAYVQLEDHARSEQVLRAAAQLAPGDVRLAALGDDVERQLRAETKTEKRRERQSGRREKGATDEPTPEPD